MWHPAFAQGLLLVSGADPVVPGGADAITAEEAREIPTSTRAPPSGWRRDDFGSPVRRSVWTPPWSLRPPHLEPEQWLSLNKKFQHREREKWRTEDPGEFNKQEERRAAYARLKAAGRVPKASPCIARLPCDYNDHHDGGTTTLAPLTTITTNARDNGHHECP